MEKDEVGEILIGTIDWLSTIVFLIISLVAFIFLMILGIVAFMLHHFWWGTLSTLIGLFFLLCVISSIMLLFRRENE
jgi:hypothetical protein